MKHIIFEEDEDPEYGKIVSVLDRKKLILGFIRKHKWKKKEELVFEPEFETFFSIDCLQQIVKEMKTYEKRKRIV